MSPALKAKSAVTASILAKTGAYALMDGATQWAFLPVESLRKGSKLILRAKFAAKDGTPCRTNFIFAATGDTVLVDNIVPPAKHTKPLGSARKSASDSPQK